MDGDALNVVEGCFDLAGMQAATDPNFERTDGLGNRAGATDCPCRAVERGQKSIPRRLDSTAVEALDHRSTQAIVLSQLMTPGTTIDLAVEPQLNEFNGRVSVELEVKDVQIS